MKDLMKRRISVPVVVGSTGPLLHDVEPLSAQLRHARFGGLEPEKKTLSDTLYDEDEVFDVDPSTDPSMDRFERTEGVAQAISSRMRKQKRDDLEHANA